MSDLVKRLERHQRAALAHFQETDNSDTMHVADVLGDVLSMIERDVLDAQSEFYEEEVVRIRAGEYD